MLLRSSGLDGVVPMVPGTLLEKELAQVDSTVI
jgi:hypothetical protein